MNQMRTPPQQLIDTVTVNSSGQRLMQTTCPYCGVGCGVDVVQKQTNGITTLSGLTGTPEHPSNYGRLCVKGTHLLDTNSLDGRLLSPQVDGQPVSWDNATATVASKLRDTIARYGPDSVAFYVSGQLLTEDYYIANKLMKGFIGSANIDTNSRLCMSSAVAAYKRAFGEDIVPCTYEDLEQTDLLILTGSNAAWTHPVLYQRIERAKLRNPAMKVVVIDPRRTDSCELADMHLSLRPGTDAFLFNGLLRYLADHQGLDQTFIDAHTRNFTDALEQTRHHAVADIASICDVDEAQLTRVYQWFCHSPRAITFFSMGINQSTSGVDKANAIINCHLASGKIGKAGSGPFSITGQPNAMGGREVGGLANMLAAHMDIENPVHRERVQRFWQSPTMAQKPGLKAVDLFKKIADGQIRFIWIMATNPVVSMPNRTEIEAALAQCETVVVSDIVQTNDTLAYADIVLPATGWSEKDGTVTNSQRTISRQRALLPPPGEARHDWQIMCDVARKMGFAAGFTFTGPAQIFSEHAALTAFENDGYNGGERALNLAGLQNLSKHQYNNLNPVTWPVHRQDGSARARLFSDGRFYTEDRRACFWPIKPDLPAQQTSREYPFLINTGRVRDQWHTMTRTGKATKLTEHTPVSYIALNPDDAKKLNVTEQQLLRIDAKCNGGAPVIAPVRLDAGLRSKECFMPIHWSLTQGSHNRVAALFNGAVDPISGQPETKQGAVALCPAKFAAHGTLVCDSADTLDLLLKHTDYWARQPLENAHTARVATHLSPADLLAVIQEQLQASQFAQLAMYHIKSTDSLALLVVSKDLPVCTLWLHPTYHCVPGQWLDALFKNPVDSATISAVLRQQPDEAYLQGPVICSCHQVRQQPIRDAIDQGADTVDALGDALKCGTQCGSCRTTLSRMLDQASTSLPCTTD